MTGSKAYKRALLPLAGSALLLLAAPSHAGGAEELQRCLAEARAQSDRAHEVSQCYWKHWERMASYGR